MAKYLAGAIALVLLLGGGAYLWMYGHIGDTGNPHSLLVRHQGETIRMSPISYCWTTGPVGVCTDGVLEFPSETDALLNTESAPLHFDFQHPWALSALVEWIDEACSYELTRTFPNRGAQLDVLGPPGDYLVTVSGNSPRGDASWALRIRNEVDLPLPRGVTC